MKDFIEAHKQEVINHYKQEGKELGYTEEELDEYVKDTIGFTVVCDKRAINRYTKGPYYIICEEDDMVAAETFDGFIWDHIVL